jgi:very-short-patch-repair endonuclease
MNDNATISKDKTRSLNSPREGWQTEGLAGCFTLIDRTKKFISLPYNPKLKDNAKALRKAGNLSEVIFWNAVKRKQLLNLDFERQKIIGNYIVDFYCAEIDLVVEIDGVSHDYKGEYDLDREKYIKNLGLFVVRFQDSDIKNNFQTIQNEFYNFCDQLKKHPVDFVATPLEGNQNITL